MASTLPVFDDTQGYTGTLSYVTGETVEVIVGVSGWYYCADIAALRAITTSTDNKIAAVADISGYGAGFYRWDATSGVADDGLMFIQPDDGGVGRWVRFA